MTIQEFVRGAPNPHMLRGPHDVGFLGLQANPLPLLGPDHLEVLVDENVVWPVDADVVNLIFAVTQLHNTVDNASRIGRQRRFRRFVGCRPTDDRPRTLTVTSRDLPDWP